MSILDNEKEAWEEAKRIISSVPGESEHIFFSESDVENGESAAPETPHNPIPTPNRKESTMMSILKNIGRALMILMNVFMEGVNHILDGMAVFTGMAIGLVCLPFLLTYRGFLWVYNKCTSSKEPSLA